MKLEIVEFNNGRFALRRLCFFIWYYFDVTTENNDVWWDMDDLRGGNFIRWCTCKSEEDVINNFKRIMSEKERQKREKENNKLKIVNKRKVKMGDILS